MSFDSCLFKYTYFIYCYVGHCHFLNCHMLWMCILYLNFQANDDIPREIDAQAAFWKKYYRTAADEQDYITAAEQLEEGKEVCQM